MTAEEKKMTMSQNLSAALNPVKIDNPANVDPVTRQEVQKKSLAELKVEIKFHLGQMAGHAVEIGKCLIEAKEQVGHGNFGKWLEENFNLSEKMAQNFMRVAERFGSKPNLSSDLKLNQSQLIAMLALPAGEEEKFIEAKAAEGTPVEDMTVKELRAEVAKYKKELESKDEQLKLKDGQIEVKLAELDYQERRADNYEQMFNDADRRLQEMTYEYNGKQMEAVELKEKYTEVYNQNQILKNELKQAEQTGNVVEIAPEDYEPMKKQLAEMQAENEKLQADLKELVERPIEVVYAQAPDDYDAVKTELAELKKKHAALELDYAVTKKLQDMLNAVPVLLNYVNLSDVVAELATKKPDLIKERIQQLPAVCTELKNHFELWEKKQAEKMRDRRVISKDTYRTFQGWLEKISNGQIVFIRDAQSKAIEIFGVKIPDEVINAPDPHKAFALWLGREINPVIESDGGYKEEIRVTDDHFDWYTVK